MRRIFLDANVPTYAVGREHPLKESCAKILAFAARNPRAFLTSAEVMQEMLHRYLHLGRWPEGRAVVVGFAAVMKDGVEPVRAEDVLLACELADRQTSEGGRALRERLRSRDLLHAATMLRLGSTRIVTADADFDGLRAEGIERLDPARFDTWRDDVRP